MEIPFQDDIVKCHEILIGKQAGLPRRLIVSIIEKQLPSIT